MSKRLVVAMIAATAAAAFAVVGAGVVAATAIGHAPSMGVPAGVIWSEMVPAKGVTFPN
jgi:hypothetical protein